MKLINVHYNTKSNINKYYLAQHVECHCLSHRKTQKH